MKQTNVIDVKSQDAQLIADFLESGYSFEQTTVAINKHKSSNNSPGYTLSGVYGCALWLKPLTTTVKSVNRALSTL